MSQNSILEEELIALDVAELSTEALAGVEGGALLIPNFLDALQRGEQGVAISVE